MRRSWHLAVLVLLASASAMSGEAVRTAPGDAMAVLRESGDSFARVLPGREFGFPADHAPHPEFRVEWWYLTANLRDATGRPFGLQWTLFRQSLAAPADTEGFDSNQMWMAHAALSTPEDHQAAERFSRGGVGLAEVRIEPVFAAWIDDWEWRGTTADMFPSSLYFTLPGVEVRVRLEREPGRDYVLQGDAGFSVKSREGQASYYYSQPWLTVRAELVRETGGTLELAGVAWLDREWSSRPLSAGQEGWDWFSLHLPGERKLMLYRLRHRDGNHYLRGSLALADGSVRQLRGDELLLTPRGVRRVRGLDLPLDWELRLPSLGLQLLVRPVHDEQWMDTSFPYWEGMMEVVLMSPARGERAGVGYMELTGYQAGLAE